MKYIFLGSSPDSARTINFMGQYKFTVGGDPVEVTDPEVLDKLKTHKFFKEISDKIKDNVVDVELEEDSVELLHKGTLHISDSHIEGGGFEKPKPKKRGRPPKKA